MRTPPRPLVGLLLGLAALAGCGRTLVFPHPQKCVFDRDCPDGLRCVDQVCQELVLPDGGPKHGNKRFGEPCDAGAECDSARCLDGPRGAFCSRECDAADAGCPTSYACKKVPEPEATAQKLVSLCAVPQPTLCQPCGALDQLDGGRQCGASGGDLCAVTDSGEFCLRDCEYEACPEGYDCVEGADFRGPHRQCIPHARTCNCTPATVGLHISCASGNQFGSCGGQRVCQADAGFSACDAPLAAQETCNGVDDDCNGAVDDFVPPTCSKTAGGRTCTGPQVCMATAGLVCAAKEPTTEVCNGQDDDCNGSVDEPFVDGQGRYTTLANCGVCNNNCAAIPQAVATTCALDATGQPRCQVQQCAAGSFPYDDSTMCLALPDTLCRACQVDGDCVGPGSKCLTIDGTNVCGRDCSLGSLYSQACPAGYSCTAAPGGLQQCTPATGTCTCRASTLGSTRSCTVTAGTTSCRGFESCTATSTWSACDVSSFNPELCDGRDNNCDNRVDEGFLNPVTGKYESAQNCGFCNNDCTKYFSPTLQHTTGVCDTAPALPACAMGPCLTEVVGSTTFEWVNVNGDTSDGCECRRVQGNTEVDLPDRAPASGTSASWVDENCDGVDGVVADAIFVSATAAAGGNGTRLAPFQTVTQGVAAMQAQGKRYVLVAQGIYRENVRLFDGAQLFGGYSSDFLKRDPKVHTTYLAGAQATAGALASIHVESAGSGAAETVVAGFTIVGLDVTSSAAEGVSGEASIAVYLKDCGPNVILTSNDLVGGRGGQGGPGATGAQGFGRQSSGVTNGVAGTASTHFASGSCSSANARPGGPEGTNPSCAAAPATAGGNVVCPLYTFTGNQGQQQSYVNPPVGSRSGRGGWDWSFDTLSGTSCSHVTESGFPVNIQQHDGDDGKPGADGAGGLGGAGAPTAARFGSVVGGRWVASPVVPTPGQLGLFGEGGGGGGAGGGVAQFLTSGGCQAWELGATGGGGGAGGCGGAGGAPGGAGGASLGILIVSTGSGALPTIRGNRLQRGLGGDGGNGGFGGAGGQGGSGGFGGTAARWSSSVGGKGGEGGNGGPGGGGGGGAGGPSVGFLGSGVAVTGYQSQNTFLTPSGTNTGGQGGVGGSAPGTTSTGTAGARGGSADLLGLVPCGAGCASGTTCDANNVCVPN